MWINHQTQKKPSQLRGLDLQKQPYLRQSYARWFQRAFSRPPYQGSVPHRRYHPQPRCFLL